MLKRLLLSAVILSAVSVSSYAVDVNIPGADPSIPKDVYVQGVYSTEKIKNSYDVETRKIIDSIISKKGEYLKGLVLLLMMMKLNPLKMIYILSSVVNLTVIQL